VHFFVFSDTDQFFLNFLNFKFFKFFFHCLILTSYNRLCQLPVSFQHMFHITIHVVLCHIKDDLDFCDFQ